VIVDLDAPSPDDACPQAMPAMAKMKKTERRQIFFCGIFKFIVFTSILKI
jgi:hypothetical protein